MKVRLCLLMELMRTVSRDILCFLEFGIKGIIHAVEAPANLHMQKTGNPAHKRFQLGSNQTDSVVFINTLLQSIQNNVLNHGLNLIVGSGAGAEQMEEMGLGFGVQRMVCIESQSILALQPEVPEPWRQ